MREGLYDLKVQVCACASPDTIEARLLLVQTFGRPTTTVVAYAFMSPDTPPDAMLGRLLDKVAAK